MAIPSIDNIENTLSGVYGPEGVALVKNLQSLVRDKSWTLDFIGREGFVAILGCNKGVPIEVIQDIFDARQPNKYEPVVSESLHYYENRVFHLIQSSNLSADKPQTQAEITRLMGAKVPPPIL
jgi:hypothetical protein